ncbi:MAG: hypothetical protein COA67_11035 [Lutibacter sp.]|nr:MAG: hypothetical protein COA67_11035 [Lutibacter sp.]
MKKITLLLLIFVLTFTFSCDSEDDTPETTYKLVKLEGFNSDDELEFSSTIEYNEDGFLNKAIETIGNETYITNYIYSNGKIVTVDYPDSDETENYTYTDDLITSSVTEEGSQTYNYTYMYNSSNQMIKKTKTTQGNAVSETTYTYDINDNALSVNYGNSNVITYTYDTKINPLRLALPNALLKIFSIGQNNKLISNPDVNYTYEYNDNDYPTKQNYYLNGDLEQYNLYTYE